MGFLGFFHKDEKEKLIEAFEDRKKNLLKDIKELFDEQNEIKRLSTLENRILETAGTLDPSEKSEIDTLISQNEAEEKIVDSLASTEKEIISLLESKDKEKIASKLKKYVYTIKQLAVKLETVDMSKKAQLSRIKDEEEKLQASAEKNAFEETIQEFEDKKKALGLLKQAVKLERQENRIARTEFYGNITKVGTDSASLVSSILDAAGRVADLVANVGRVAVAGSDKLASKMEQHK